MLPGKGDINLKEIIKQVKGLNEIAPYIIEVYSENYSELEELKRAREHVESLGD